MRGKIPRPPVKEECLYCQVQAISVEFDDELVPDDLHFDCLTFDNGEVGTLQDNAYQIELPTDFVTRHIEELQTGLSTICVPGGKAIRLASTTSQDHVIVPEGAEIRMLSSELLTPDGPSLGLGSRSVLVATVSGTSQSTQETPESMAGAVFGLGSQALGNSMRAQFQRCSHSRIDFTPASGFPELSNGVVDIQLDYSLEGQDIFQVLKDADASVATALGVNTLGRTFDHVIFCIARGTTYGPRQNAGWSAFAYVRGWRSVFNSNRCDKLSTLMHEIGHNFGLVHAASFDDPYGDTTGTVSFGLAQVSFSSGPCLNEKQKHLFIIM